MNQKHSWLPSSWISQELKGSDSNEKELVEVDTQDLTGPSTIEAAGRETERSSSFPWAQALSQAKGLQSMSCSLCLAWPFSFYSRLWDPIIQIHLILFPAVHTQAGIIMSVSQTRLHIAFFTCSVKLLSIFPTWVYVPTTPYPWQGKCTCYP